MSFVAKCLLKAILHQTCFVLKTMDPGPFDVARQPAGFQLDLASMHGVGARILFRKGFQNNGKLLLREIVREISTIKRNTWYTFCVREI